MADSAREKALNGLKVALATISGPTVQRNGVEPEVIPTAGLIVVRDGRPVLVEETLSPHTYWYEDPVPVEVFVQLSATADRDSTLDGLLQDIADTVSADRTLGGTVDYAQVRAPQSLEEEAVSGAPDIKTALVHLVLKYNTTDPLK